MTSTNTLAVTGPPPASPGGTAKERREEKARRRRAQRTTGTVAAVVGAVLVAGGGGGGTWYVLSERGALAEDAAAADRLLDTSENRVAEPTTRDALAASLGEAEDVLDAAFPVSLLIGGAGDYRDDLGTTSDAVHASMLDLARTEVGTAREGLAAVVPGASAVLTATDGLGADEARNTLRSALDTATALDTLAAAALEGTDVAALEEAEADLAAQRDGVLAASQALYDAQDAITCPAPDQVWSDRSGRLDAAELAAIPWAPTYSVRADLLPGLVALDAAYQQAFGKHLTVNSAYRTYDEQLAIFDPTSPIAAPPGCSNHGLGVAVDFGGGVETFGTAPYTWLKSNAATHGWEHPAWAEPAGRIPEPWHWQSVEAPAASR